MPNPSKYGATEWDNFAEKLTVDSSTDYVEDLRIKIKKDFTDVVRYEALVALRKLWPGQDASNDWMTQLLPNCVSWLLSKEWIQMQAEVHDEAVKVLKNEFNSNCICELGGHAQKNAVCGEATVSTEWACRELYDDLMNELHSQQRAACAALEYRWRNKMKVLPFSLGPANITQTEQAACKGKAKMTEDPLQMCPTFSAKPEERTVSNLDPNFSETLIKEQPTLSPSQQGSVRPAKEEMDAENGLFRPPSRIAVKAKESIRSLELEHDVKGIVGDRLLTPLEQWVLWWERIKEPERTGYLATLIQSKRFELLCMLVICINSVVVLHNTNKSMRLEEDFQTPLFDLLFTLYYTLELLLKLLVHRHHYFLNEDSRWNVFDFMLVCGGITDVVSTHALNDKTPMNPGFMRFFRMLRISKIFRIVRLLQFFTELRLMLRCVMGSFVALFWSFVLLFGFTLVFAIVFVQSFSSYVQVSGVSQQLREEIHENFGSVELAILTLFKAIAGGNDWGEYYRIIAPMGTFAACIFLVYILFVWLSITNIITSIFVDRAMRLAQPDMDDLLFQKHKADLESAEELKEVFANMTADANGRVSNDQFLRHMKDDKIKSYLELKGVPVKDPKTFFKMLTSMGREDDLDLETFVYGCLKMKGLALNVDVLSLAFDLKTLQERQHRDMANMQNLLQAHLTRPLVPTKVLSRS